MRGVTGLVVALAGCDAVFNLDRGPDAAPTAQACPADYASSLPTRPATLLKFAIAERSAYEHAQLCRMDLPGRTHLAAPTTKDDVLAMLQLLSQEGLTEPLFFVGGVQRRTATSAAEGWVRITGGDLPAQWNGVEPEDGGEPERHVEDIAALWGTGAPGGMIDVDGRQQRYAICACDDEQITLEAEAILDALPR